MTHTFRIQIKNIKKPPMWRRLEIPGNYTFHQFHTAIQLAFGWQFEHLYQFMEHAYEGSWSICEKPQKEADSYQ